MGAAKLCQINYDDASGQIRSFMTHSREPKIIETNMPKAKLCCVENVCFDAVAVGWNTI